MKQDGEYDLAIVGGGMGGYVAAVRAAQLGMSVTLVERDRVGGTCLHRGCIPSKSYLRTAELVREVGKASEFGVRTSEPVLDWEQARNRKNKLVQTLFAGVQGLIRKNGVELIHGSGTVGQDGGELIVRADGRTIPARHVLVATGSRPETLGLAADNRCIMTSDQAIERSGLPASVIIAGGGTIGMEWASLYRDCGVDVTVVEASSAVLPAEDEEIGKELRRLFERRGVRFLTNARVDAAAVARDGSGVRVPIAQEGAGQPIVLRAEALLVAVGRRPCVEGLGLEALGLDPAGKFLPVDGFQRTPIPRVYAAGDVCGGGLAHAAALQGVIAAEHMAGLAPRPFDPDAIPKCTYTFPEAAGVGLTEAAARLRGIDVRTGRFPFRAVGKALVAGDFEGFAKIVADAGSGKIVGVHIVGPHATELIAEGGLALAGGLGLSQWGLSVRPHPSLSEVLHEAALAAEGRAIHF